MATAAKSVSVSTSSHPDDRFTPTLPSMNDTLQLSPSGDGRVEPYELVELFYGSGSSTQASPNTTPSQQPSPSAPHHSPRSNGTSSPEVMQVVEINTRVPSQRTASYTCDACGRSFKEASHFTKHKRGALCRKLSQRLAKNSKKKNNARGGENGTDRRNKNSTIGVHKPYQCNMCGARFYDRVNMEFHLERHHSTSQQLWVEIGRPVTGGSSCAECNRSFQDRAEATDHHRQHLSANMAPSNTPQPAPSLIYYHDPLHQVQAYPQPNQPPPNTQSAPQQPPPPPPQTTHLSVPPPPPAPAPPPPPPTAHIHPNMTILHTPQLAPPPSLIPLAQTASTQPPNIPTLSNVRVGEEGGKSSKGGSNAGGKCNICGECGQRFCDPMNIELHIQRLHPASRLLCTVSVGGGTFLYNTTNSRPDVQNLINDPPPPQPPTPTTESSSPSHANTQTFSCKLCGYKATTRNYMLVHLHSYHASNNTDLIHVLETLESGQKAPKGKGKKGGQDPPAKEQRHICCYCGDLFSSKAELIRHRIKDKQYKCSVCSNSYCSQQQVVTHMNKFHPQNSPPAPNSQILSLLGNLNCWVCGLPAGSAAGLDEHLVSHGSVIAQCVLCGEQKGSLCSLLPHLEGHLPRRLPMVRMTITRADQPPSTHTLEVAALGATNFESGFTSTIPVSTPEESAPNRVATEQVAEPSRVAAAYACSECGVCFSAAAQLEAHLQVHQNPPPNTSSISSQSSLNAYSSAPTPNQTVCKVSGSFEFRCEECGFWRADSEPVMLHIRAVHMSGNMMHSVRLPSGLIQIHPIHVVTPISTLGPQ